MMHSLTRWFQLIGWPWCLLAVGWDGKSFQLQTPRGPGESALSSIAQEVANWM